MKIMKKKAKKNKDLEMDSDFITPLRTMENKTMHRKKMMTMQPRKKNKRILMENR
jgi:hypothetical protein